MGKKKVAILLFLFIFGIMTHVWADQVKFINNAAGQEMSMHMDKNRTALQKKNVPPNEPIDLLKRSEDKIQSDISYTDYGVRINMIKSKINFLKALEQEKKPLLKELLDKLTFSYEFTQNVSKYRFSMFLENTKVKSPNSDFSQLILTPYPNWSKYFEEGGGLTRLKLHQSKRIEILKEIFLGLRLSFPPMNGYILLDMNGTPSYEKGSSFIIPLQKEIP
jgi:hypothetical protein